MLRLARIVVLRSPAALMMFVIALALEPACAWAEGMPQLDFKNTLLFGQVFWGAVIFGVFYFILSRSALPRVARVLSDRRQRIEGDLETARQARRGADQAVDALRRVRRESAAQAQENIDRVIREARTAADTENRALAERLKREIAEAEARITVERNDALAALPDVATEAAEAILKKILPSSMSEGGSVAEKVRGAVSAALEARAG